MVTAPVTGLTRRLVPSSLTTRSRSTVGLKSMLMFPLIGSVEVPTRVAAPVAGSTTNRRAPSCLDVTTA